MRHTVLRITLAIVLITALSIPFKPACKAHAAQIEMSYNATRAKGFEVVTVNPNLIFSWDSWFTVFNDGESNLLVKSVSSSRCTVRRDSGGIWDSNDQGYLVLPNSHVTFKITTVSGRNKQSTARFTVETWGGDRGIYRIRSKWVQSVNEFRP